MPQFSNLCLCIPDVNVLPKGIFGEHLERYKVAVGKHWSKYTIYEDYANGFTTKSLMLRLYKQNAQGITLRKLKLKLYHNSQVDEHGHRSLFKIPKLIHLDGFKGINNVVDEFDEEGLPQCKDLLVVNNVEIRYIINLTGQIHPRSGFLNLESLCAIRLVKLEKIYNNKLTSNSFGKLR